ncbi:tetratricopeptide repeat protein [Bartonella sp. HY329]|uniref:tetratricopeptide repeat protein n=1 Tax=unclassified Bartonella TaxID=2645622 RepID=UPI0021C72343|nr:MULTISPECIES: tetratricopeptide repeat protein [unclassified Bartonella]UXM95300.1 tetratricopeptide repeat protein [Bartonella sp. HY329]UXN09625.1 tetratricopeptide repeat protein [Bartonella sp. HY328]
MEKKLKYRDLILACCAVLLTAPTLSAVIISFSHAQEAPQFPPEHEPLESPLEPDDVVPLRPNVKPDQAIEDPNKSKNLLPLVKKTDELNTLFTSLKRSADVKEAQKISQQIQGLWSQSGSATIDLLMGWAEDAARNQDYAQAMDFLDNVVALDPNYAEGWMRRASIHIQMNDISLAVLELNRVLQIEPRHFNALMQLGAIFEMTNREPMAIDIYNKALDIYPQMVKVQKRIVDLLEKSTDRAI